MATKRVSTAAATNGFAGALAKKRLNARAGRMRRAVKAAAHVFAPSTATLLWRGSLDGRVTFMSRGWTDITGIPVTAALGESGWAWKEWIHPDDRRGLVADWAAARASGEPLTTFRRVLHTGGTYRWLKVTARPVRNSNREIMHWEGVSRPVDAEMRESRSAAGSVREGEGDRSHRPSDESESERRYRSIFERSHVALFEQDLTELVEALRPLHAEYGDTLATHLVNRPSEMAKLLNLLKTRDVNDAALLFLGKDRRTILSQSRPEVVDLRPFAELLENIAGGAEDHWEGVVTLAASDGTIRKAICGVTLMRGTYGTRAFTALNDITEREQTREQLIEAREELSRANRALTVGAMSMTLAHELGQPISSIAMAATAARRLLDRMPADTASASDAVDRVISSARRAANLLQDTREQAVRRRRSVEMANLLDVVQTSVGLFENEIRLQGCSIIVVADQDVGQVAVDRAELQQVLSNLILNALAATKRTAAQDRAIEVAVMSNASGESVVEVRDGGGGLPIGDEDRIFDPHFTTTPGSVGMGLALCRTIIEGFGGRLTGHNNAVGGATFMFTLPRF